MEWEKLLSKKTQVARELETDCWDKYPISDFEKDYKSIISSAAFRRLQDKTQVFPLDKSDFVRTRLTHSVEVSTIARQLGIMVTKNKTKYLPKEFAENPNIADDISSVLSCAGLLHDLGNPPFGHFGEVVIRDWFKKELEKNTFTYKGQPVSNVLSDVMKTDLCNFEGNAQALRILSKVTHNPSGYDANLTYSVLNTLIKYPTSADMIDDKNKDVKKHKMGYFYSEKKLFEEICSETGTSNGTEAARHPLTYLMEAADDIAYATSDLEDALKKDMFTVDEFIEFFKSNMPEKENSKIKELIDNLCARLECQERSRGNDLIAFQKWTEYTKKWLMYVAAFSFSKNYDSIMRGEYDKDLFYDGFHKQSIKILKKAMVKFAFNSPEILKLELAAKKIISSLLDDFVYAVIHWTAENEEYRLSKTHNKLINIVSGNCKNDYLKAMGNDEAENLYLRFLMVTDYISGMTDSYAKNLYQELNGIN